MNVIVIQTELSFSLFVIYMVISYAIPGIHKHCPSLAKSFGGLLTRWLFAFLQLLDLSILANSFYLP